MTNKEIKNGKSQMTNKIIKNGKKILLIFFCFKTMIEAVPGKISHDSKIKIEICKEEIKKIEEEIMKNDIELNQRIEYFNNLRYPISLSFLIKGAKKRTELKNDALKKGIQEINHQISQLERE